ncbi:uncharacterized protein LOC105939464 isoform X2 [Fundulus heteroclitus]|uniref:uncharacterized protein LOC105939464 isoform X2 n=1 Tax=Fundulus heteroclitus TaxID=8078 RepID=UPI00165A48EC|nr:uncharacterized protein LOC105939464 isoform X2 [Fundulus heteroclitus]
MESQDSKTQSSFIEFVKKETQVIPGQQLLVVKEEVRHDWSCSLYPHDSKPPHMKEEVKLNVKNEKEKPEFPVCSHIKPEDKKREPPTCSLAEQMETEPGEEDCGKPEPGRNPSPICSFQESEVTIHQTDQQLLGMKREAPRDLTSDLNQKDPQAPHIKEEDEELWIDARRMS